MEDKLEAFLNPTIKEIKKQVIISERFVDKDGKPIPITIKAITEEENAKIRKQSMIVKKVRGQEIESLDNNLYSKKLILACVVEPNFSNAEFCKAYGVIDPLDVLDKMFFASEFNTLIDAIIDINGFNDSYKEIAKNS